MTDQPGITTSRQEEVNPFKVIVDISLLLFSFALAFFLKRGNLVIEGRYFNFLPLYLCCWGLSSIFTSKFREEMRERRYYSRIAPYFYSALYFAGLLSLFIYGFEFYRLSRFIVYGSIGIYLILEIFVISGVYFPIFKEGASSTRQRFSVLVLLMEFVLIISSYFAVHFVKMDTLIIASDKHYYILMFVICLWLFSGLMVHRFAAPAGDSYFKIVIPFIKTYFLIGSIFSSAVFGFRLDGFSRLLAFGTLILFAFSEILILTIYYIVSYIQKSDIPEINFFAAPVVDDDKVVNGIIEKERGWVSKYSLPKEKFSSIFIREKLRHIYLRDRPELFKFINRSIDLSSVDIVKSEVMDTGNPYNFEVLPDNSFEFLINLYKINGFRYINKYLINVNRILSDGGVFITKFEPSERRFFYYKKKYPLFFARLFYFFDFLYKRIFPKTPFLKKIYYVFTKGKNRVFSMAQGLGRFYYCGFEIVSLDEVDNFVWVTVKKISKPKTDFIPSYGFFFKQKRVGKDGNLIYIYKIRTMHPFSEFIHRYIYERNRLDEKGKIKDDYRITGWGRLLRKLWIDELPMFVNWLKRDLKLVGVRPLSETFFNTYPRELQLQRIKYKPGLIPPFYADMPRSMDEVWQSEKKYLDMYEKNPFRTDFKYFWRAFYNIVFKHVKSG